MVSDSVWLGSGRSTVFKLAKLVSGITVLVWAGMVINRLFFGGNGMYELLRPGRWYHGDLDHGFDWPDCDHVVDLFI